MAYTQAIVLYENYIMGREKKIKMAGMTKEEKFNGAKEVIRYAFTELLGWTPDEAIHHVSKALLDQLHLTEYIKEYYKDFYPDDLVRDMDYDYMVAIAFDMPVDYKQQLLKHKALIKSGVENKYKKELFAGEYGVARASYLLMDMISTSVSIPTDGPGTNIEKLYARFADSPAITKILKKEGLYNACTKLYNSPLEFLHYSLSPDLQDPLLLSLHEFDHLFQTTEVTMNAEAKRRKRS